MKLEIETWILSKGYSNNIVRLFNESVTCYRNSAYRASFIFSYMGFLTIIKETIIRSQRPVAFLEAEWNSVITKINNDDQWEKEVYEALIRSAKPIFPLNDDLRLQFKYWKDRRNDCAHFKDNEIESHHTEAFWSFIKSNIPKITVEGGIDSLLNKFSDHFDDTKTPPNTDFTYLVKEIENSVLVTELQDFFKKLKSRVDGRRFWYSDSPVLDVYCKILDVASPKIHEALVDFLRQNDRDVKFLTAFPDKVLQLNYSPAEIRSLWKGRITDRTLNLNPFAIFCGLLRKNSIPKDQIEEANEELFNCFSQTSFHKLPENSDIETLKANGFFETIFDIAIKSKELKDYGWVNDKCDILILFIECHKLKSSTVERICSTPSQWLIRELKNTFANNADLKNDFHRIASDKGYKIPLDLR